MSNLKNNLVKLAATFFYIGYLPVAPGTFGSLAGVALYLFVLGSVKRYLLVTGLLLFLGFIVSGIAERILKKKDSPYIVIDEVAGMLLSMASLLFFDFNLLYVWLAFFLFRITDTLKPYPAYKLQHLRGSLGIMIDDLVAAFYTNIILQLVLRFASNKAS